MSPSRRISAERVDEPANDLRFVRVALRRAGGKGEEQGVVHRAGEDAADEGGHSGSYRPERKRERNSRPSLR